MDVKKAPPPPPPGALPPTSSQAPISVNCTANCVSTATPPSSASSHSVMNPPESNRSNHHKHHRSNSSVGKASVSLASSSNFMANSYSDSLSKIDSRFAPIETVNTSDNSVEKSSTETIQTASFDSDCQPNHTTTTLNNTVQTSATNSPKLANTKRENKWQIIEGLKVGQRYEAKPQKFFGYIHKRRKRPLKGWHKRYFYLENGIFTYSKSASDMSKGKIHGKIDVGLSVISTKESSKRIDIDSESYLIFHLKVKKSDQFYQWVDALRNHRLARQHEITYGSTSSSVPFDSLCDDGKDAATSDHELPLFSKPPLQPLSHFMNNNNAKSLSPAANNVVDDPLQKLQEKLVKLSSLLRYIEVKNSLTSTVTDLEGFKYKKPRRRFHLRRKKSSLTSKSQPKMSLNHAESFSNARKLKDAIESDSNLLESQQLSHSQPNLDNDELCHNSAIFNAQNQIDDSKHISKAQAMSEFLKIANQVNNDYRELVKRMQSEKSKLLLQTQQSHQQQQAKERTKSLDSRTTSFEDPEECTFRRTLSKFSADDQSIISMSEYYDAEEQVSPSDYNSSTSEEEDDDESITTDFSEEGNNFEKQDLVSATTGRRTKLPSIQPKGDISLWSLLCKNIGKDLSKISMPVTINEPLNVLQRLCEELEYCELLDTAASIEDPCKRMLMMAAFAVSAYSSSTYRAGHKPFNPLLGETFECIREDKGFRFHSEQVSHHPPVSACFADSKNYHFWQDLRVKSKFWGKSMEVIPSGTVNVHLKNFDCHYSWNKITTCVHNLFKGERYVDNYGELTIKEHPKDQRSGLTCKITFEKAGYWSSKKNEISGVITNAKGEVIEKIFGRWNESIHCGVQPQTRCIWRPGALPDNFQDYYGFSRFAIELNELTETDKLLLPPTDTRFRPDQRLLEEGKIAEAETCKLELEQKQRERRKQREEGSLPDYKPLWFRRQVDDDENETYTTTSRYWPEKDNRFEDIDFETLW